jgi:hypothetical protein
MTTTTVGTQPAGRYDLSSVLLRCGVIAGPVFIAAFLVEGATRADYDPIRHPVSSLQLGAFGWTQVTNFILAGALTVVSAAGLRRTLGAWGKTSTWGPLLVALVGIGLIGAGVFVTDPANGYPPGTPAIVDYSWHGALHDGFSVFTFVGWPAACFVFARYFARVDQRSWAAYSAASGALFAICFVLTNLGFSQTEGLRDIAGLLQRMTVTIGWAWLTLLAIHTSRANRSDRL